MNNVCFPGRLTFWINIFNTMVLHLHIIMGPPTNIFLRKSFFNHFKYKIGKFYFSLNDIFYGILRGYKNIFFMKKMNILFIGNPKSPLTRHRQFRGTDPRRKFVLPLDPRIHFALSLLNKSSPFIRIYTGINLKI